ncbi:LysR family transcriptional regulator [Catenulispora yoronensis]
MAKDLDTTLLRSFVTAVRAGSISRAAVALGHTQPALSQQLRKLEHTVGRPLLHRSPSGVSPTRAGEELLPYAERILSLSEQALSQAGRALTGHCSIGLLEDLAVSQLPQALADLAGLHPDATLEVLSLSNAEMREAYETHRVQLVLDAVGDLPGPPRWTVRRPWPGRSAKAWTRQPIRCRWCCSRTRASGAHPCCRRWKAPTAAGE